MPRPPLFPTRGRSATHLRDRTVRRIQIRHPESELQQSIVAWFWRSVSPGEAYLYSVPNGAHLTATQAEVLLKEGLRSGVSDLVLLLPCGRSVHVEVKTENDAILGTTRTYPKPQQRVFMADAEALGHRYVVVRSLLQFVELLDDLGVPFLAWPAGPMAGQSGRNPTPGKRGRAKGG